MEYREAEIDDELQFDDELQECRYAVCVTGLNRDRTESGYFKLVSVYDDGDKAIDAAWCVGKDSVTDRPIDMKSFLVTVEEAVQSDENPEEYDFVGTIFKTDLIL